jgi:DNA (cytosine-5)-methyltransferase 1
LKDVLESEVDEKYFLSDKMLGYLNNRNENSIFGKGKLKFRDENSVASTLTKSSSSLDISDNILKVGYINQDTQASQVFSEKGTSPNICAGTHGYALGYVETEIGTWRTHEDGKGFRATEDNNCPTIPARAREDGSGQPVVKIGAFRGRNPDNPSDRTTGANLKQTLEINESGTSNALTSVQKDNVVIIQSNTSKGFDEAEEEEDSINFSVPSSKTRRGRVGKKVSQTLDTQCNQGIFTQQRIRRLTPRECFRLMDFNEDMIEKTIGSGLISDSQCYKQAGNSICVGVLAAIISKLKF